MRTIRCIAIFFTVTILSSFIGIDKYSMELKMLQKYELLALKKEQIGKAYMYDLTHKKDCDKTSIKYLGIIETTKGKKYKVLSSFFVFSAAITCHATRNIKIYDMENKFVGKYYVGMPYDLPAKITENKFIYWTKSKECDSRNGFLISFEKGLPKRFFLPCTKSGGDFCDFSSK